MSFAWELGMDFRHLVTENLDTSLFAMVLVKETKKVNALKFAQSITFVITLFVFGHKYSTMIVHIIEYFKGK